MESLFILLVAVLVFVIVAPIVALVWLSRLARRIEAIARRVTLLEDGRAGEAPPPEARDRPPVPTAIADSDAAAATPEETPAEDAAPGVAGPWEPRKAPPEPAGPDREPSPVSAEPAAPPEPREPGWEERFASNWMVWLGGLTVALAAVFLFRYAIDQGWLTPFTRVVMGLVLGGLLLAGSEWAERSPIAGTERLVKPDHVPPALAASGIFAIFVSVYAAHALYGLIGPAGAFITLALVSYSALVLSLRQGWFVALLGIVAGYAVPALVAAPEANAPATFLYLYVLTLGALALMVWRRWWWFAVLALAGAFLWPYFWSIAFWPRSDQLTLSLYTLGLAAAFAALSVRLPAFAPEDRLFRWIAALLSESSGIGFALSGALLLHLANAVKFNEAGFVFLVLYAALALVAGVWRRSLEGLLVIAALVVVVMVLVWPQPLGISPPARVAEIGVEPVSGPFGPYVMPPEFFAFSRALWALAAIFGLGGFFALARVSARPVWAGLSAFMPVLLFAGGYWRIAAFGISVAWGWWAIGLAVLELLAAISVARRLSGAERDVALGFYAAAVTAAIALAFACVLREAWLTVALAAEVTAIGWIWRRLRVEALKPIAIAVLSVVIVRLVANPEVLEYQGTVLGMFGWVVYGYGLPAGATALAARLFRNGEPDLTVTLCEIAAAGFTFLTVALQLKLWTSGSIYTAGLDFLDTAVQANWMIVATALLLSRRFAESRPWARVAGLGTLALAGVLVGLVLVLAENPLLHPHPVGDWPLVNLLGLAYLLPAALFLFMASSRGIILRQPIGLGLSAAAGVLIFVDLTLEVRRAFQGTIIQVTWQSWPTNAEFYAYSAAWILFALVLLAMGIRWRAQHLRHASLAVLTLTVAKVFLYDMSDLTGLYRVASFLGLGLALIGIGRVYRVFVFAEQAPASPEPPEEEGG